MPSRHEDLVAEPPSINPYQVLGIEEQATADEIKSAYRKKALQHHPDKVPTEAQEAAKQTFQEIACAYAILSDERRRRRYDRTGNASESLDLSDDDFDWETFYREQFSSMVNATTIEQIKREYQGSAEERQDLLAAFEEHEGQLDRVYEVVLLSSVLDDDERFRALLDQAIAAGEVQGWTNYTEEPARQRQRRLKRAREEAREAEQASRELDSRGRGRKTKPKQKTTGAQDLAVQIQQRQEDRAEEFFARLEAKYAGTTTTKKRRSREDDDEPPEAAFAAVGARKKKTSAGASGGVSKRAKGRMK
ncbi:DnaJ domain containing protein [Elaphomyces granulatus]|jgi:DnaJ family protein C protein 9